MMIALSAKTCFVPTAFHSLLRSEDYSAASVGNALIVTPAMGHAVKANNARCPPYN